MLFLQSSVSLVFSIRSQRPDEDVAEGHRIRGWAGLTKTSWKAK